VDRQDGVEKIRQLDATALGRKPEEMTVRLEVPSGVAVDQRKAGLIGTKEQSAVQ
jgi:hypothetical protein